MTRAGCRRLRLRSASSVVGDGIADVEQGAEPATATLALVEDADLVRVRIELRFGPVISLIISTRTGVWPLLR